MPAWRDGEKIGVLGSTGCLSTAKVELRDRAQKSRGGVGGSQGQLGWVGPVRASDLTWVACCWRQLLGPEFCKLGSRGRHPLLP